MNGSCIRRYVFIQIVALSWPPSSFPSGGAAMVEILRSGVIVLMAVTVMSAGVFVALYA